MIQKDAERSDKGLEDHIRRINAFLTLVLFYGIVLLIFEYVFGVTLWNPVRGGGVGMGG
jgi:hypothetical protein